MTSPIRAGIETAIAGTVTVALMLGLGATTAAATDSDTALQDDELTTSTLVDTFESEAGVESRLLADGDVETTIEDAAGVTGKVKVSVEQDTDGAVHPTVVEIDTHVDGEHYRADLVVESFMPMGGEDFVATLRVAETGETLTINTTMAQQQAVPVLVLLGILARFGIKHIIKWYGKQQIKKAVKSYLLNSISKAKWTHIMAPKHKWGSVGAKSREQVADLMGRAMAEGSHKAYGSSGKAMVAVWKHKGKTIEVTYSKSTGKVSNGWVK
ncbi:SAR2788 family putative toxin [Promicromonospora sp. CA-289599]|uniref:SAR2788 family putative toxin n=1 Tax=Promicromonospora sp. CA-289599 TaxID=3240014 RepID=UPI003D8E173A